MGDVNRRGLIAGTTSAAVIWASDSASSHAAEAPGDRAHGSNPLFPAGRLHVLGFLMRDTGQDLQVLIDWYENIHSVNARYIWPFMTRYARNYITKVEEGPKPPYRVLTEFDWKDEAGKAQARALLEAHGGQALESERRGPALAWLTDIYALLVPAEPTRFGAVPPPRDPTKPVPGRALLLRRAPAASQERFEAAVRDAATRIAALAPDVEVTADLIPGPRTSPDQPDAVILARHAPAGELPRPDAAACEVMNLFAIETRGSPV